MIFCASAAAPLMASFAEISPTMAFWHHGVMTFLAGLELSRRRLLLLRQSSPFTELWIYRREDEEEGRDPEDTRTPEEEGAAQA